MNINIFKNISTTDITFIKDISKQFKIDKTGEFKYFTFYNFESLMIKEFISSLDNNTLYTIIPFISITCKTDDPFLILSNQIIISKHSNYLTIINFLNAKYEDAIDQFMLNEKIDNKLSLIFKYKKLKLLNDNKF